MSIRPPETRANGIPRWSVSGTAVPWSPSTRKPVALGPPPPLLSLNSSVLTPVTKPVVKENGVSAEKPELTLTVVPLS